MIRRFLQEHGLPLGILLAAALIVLHRTVLFGAWPFVGDVVDQFQPWAEYTRRCFGRGEVPLWNPYNNCGTPFLANLQSAVFYPINLLLLPLPSGLAIGISNIIHFVIAGWGAYWMTRRFGIGKWGGCLAGMAYMLNGFAMIHLFAGNILTLFAAAWIPWAFLAAEWAFQTKGWRVYLLGASMIWALHFLCGHAQMTFYTAVFTTLYVLVRAAVSHKRSDLIALTRFFTAAAFGIVLTAIQFLPTAEYAQNSSRAGGLSYEQATEFSLPPNRIINFFLPDFFGSHADQFPSLDDGPDDEGNVVYQHSFWGHWAGWSNNYIGIPTILFALLLLVTVIHHRDLVNRKSILMAWLVVGGFAFICAAGRYLPLYQWIYSLPGFCFFRAPSKYTPYLILPLILAGGAGFDRLYNRTINCDRISLIVYPATTLLIIGFMLLIIRHVLSSTWMSNLWSVHIRLPLWIAAVLYSSIHALGCFLAFYGLWRFYRSERLKGTGFAVAVLFLLFSDLFVFGSRYVILHSLKDPYRSIVGPWVYHGPEKRTTHVTSVYDGDILGLVKIPTDQRVVVHEEGLVRPNLFLLAERETVGGYDPLAIGRYVEFVKAMKEMPYESMSGEIEREQYAFVDVIDGILGPPAWPRMDYWQPQNISPDIGDIMAGVEGFLWGGWRGGGPMSSLFVSQYIGCDEYKERPARSRFFSGQSLKTDREFPEDASKNVIITHSISDRMEITSKESVPVNFKKAGPQGKRLLEVDAPAEGYLYLSDAYYPGWVARDADGTEYPIVPANHAFRAVKLPPGKHKITFTYEPASFRIGKNITLAALLVWLGMLLWEARNRKVTA